jgi:cell pole-organizing protein PopZ
LDANQLSNAEVEMGQTSDSNTAAGPSGPEPLPLRPPIRAVRSSVSHIIPRQLEAYAGYGLERSIGDLARELLQPMLKQWLDENLPIVVERLVQEEIKRLGERMRS